MSRPPTGRLTVGALFVVVLWVTACRDATAPSSGSDGSGALTVRLATESVEAGAVQVLIEGATVDSLDSALAHYSAQIGPDRYRVIVAGDVRAGPLLRLRIPDSRRVGDYRATVEQASARFTYLQLDPATVLLVLEAGPVQP